MFNQVGPLEILLVLGIALIIFGPKRLPELGRSMGKGIREFRSSLSGEHKDEEANEAKRELSAGQGVDSAPPGEPVEGEVVSDPKR